MPPTLKALGLLLLTTAVFKGCQPLTEPVANRSIWGCQPLQTLQVEFELALGIWLLSSRPSLCVYACC